MAGSGAIWKAAIRTVATVLIRSLFLGNSLKIPFYGLRRSTRARDKERITLNYKVRGPVRSVERRQA